MDSRDAPVLPATSEAVVVPETAGSSPAAPRKQKNRSKCFECNKKIGLTGFECRCGSTFCGAHRYADEHRCGFDYVAFERAQLSKANQQVVGAKLERL